MEKDLNLWSTISIFFASFVKTSTDMKFSRLQIIPFLLLWLFLLDSCKSEVQPKEALSEILDYEAVDGESELRKLNDLLIKEPENAELLAQRADILFKLLRQDEGLNDISKAFRLDSNSLVVRSVHAGYMLGQLKVLSARDDYNFIIQKDPGNADAYLGLARTYAVENNNAKAFQYADEALKRNIRLRDAYVLKGLIFRIENKIDLSISSYQTAVEIDPNYYSGFVSLGDLHKIKNNPLALEYFNTALQINPKGTDALYGRGLYLQDAGEIDEAQKIYRKILKIDPDFYVAYYNQGYIKLVKQSQFDSAVYFFTKTIEIEPFYADAWYNLGLSEQALGKNREAIAAFKETLKINKDFKKAEIEINNILNMK